MAPSNQRTTLPQSALRAASSLREGAGKRSHSTGYSLKSQVTGDFHRPYENSECFTAQKIFRFLTQKRYRVGQGTHVWEPAECVTEKTRWTVCTAGFGEGRGYSAEMR